MLFKCDNGGYLLPPISDLSTMPEDNSKVLGELIKSAVSVFKSNLLTVFFRGSQLFSIETADFDIVIILQRGEEDDAIERFRKESTSAASLFEHIIEIDCMICTLSDVRAEKHLQFVAQVLSVRVFGKDISSELQKFKADISSVYLFEKTQEKVDTFNKVLKLDLAKEQANSIFNYMIKYVIRTCFELVILYKGIYCREIKTCNNYFSELYPNMAGFSKTLLSQYNNNTIDNSHFLELVNMLLSFSTIQINLYQTVLSHEIKNH